jgi:aldose 1-epimerase
VWKPQGKLSDAKLFTPAELASIEGETTASALFSYTSPEGTEGFPGALDVEVVWALTNPSRTFDPQTYERRLGSVVLIYRAQVRNEPEVDGTKIVTPINLTHHWGFNLDASFAEALGSTPDAKSHKLYINANKILEGNEFLLPTGKLIDIKGTRFDFTEPDTAVGSRYEGGYGKEMNPSDFPRSLNAFNAPIDNFYLFPPSSTRQPSHVSISGLRDGTQNLIPTVFEKGEPQTRLSSDRSGIRLAFHTNRTCVEWVPLSSTGLTFGNRARCPALHGDWTRWFWWPKKNPWWYRNWDRL